MILETYLKYVKRNFLQISIKFLFLEKKNNKVNSFSLGTGCGPH
jgi:hypothetical protein